MVLLWVRRANGRRWMVRSMTAAAVSLQKALPEDPRRMWDSVYAAPRDNEWWIKIRQLARNLLLLAASLTAAALLGLPGQESRQVVLQRAGAEVATAIVAEPPRIVDKTYDDDDPSRVVSYRTAMTVSIPGGPTRLALEPVWTTKPRRVGQRISVLWAQGKPELGGYTARSEELTRLAKGKWDVDLLSVSADEPFGVVIGGIFGFVMLPWAFMFSLGLDEDDLSASSWSPVTQAVHALFALGVAYGCTPALVGRPAQGDLQRFWEAGGWFLIPFLIFTPVARMIREHFRN
ncbi:hypothetical protein AC230_25760 [Streptomyces caatingaensis]|uniref:Uncharacterized protein n=2 Tax=Streptomyces caatingaensis TaxID=1678637 RepID=A0A0K9X9K5_9ACTN|nr:hypothetical protein AC230_25760 [Streptomyces caatingaensis]